MNDALKPACPECGTNISLQDVDVAQDIALCRKCHRNFSLGETIDQDQDSTPATVAAADLGRPPKGVWYKRTPNGFELGASTRSALALFLVPFLLAWAGGSLGGIYWPQISNGDFHLFRSLFGLPFLVGTVVIGSFAMMSVCGRFCIRAEGSHGELFAGVGPVGFRRKFRWDQVKDIRLETKRSAKGGRYLRILIDADRPVTIMNFTEARRNFFLAALRQLHRDSFPAARAVPPKMREAA